MGSETIFWYKSDLPTVYHGRTLQIHKEGLAPKYKIVRLKPLVYSKQSKLLELVFQDLGGEASVSKEINAQNCQ